MNNGRKFQIKSTTEWSIPTGKGCWRERITTRGPQNGRHAERLPSFHPGGSSSSSLSAQDLDTGLPLLYPVFFFFLNINPVVNVKGKGQKHKRCGNDLKAQTLRWRCLGQWGHASSPRPPVSNSLLFKLWTEKHHNKQNKWKKNDISSRQNYKDELISIISHRENRKTFCVMRVEAFII